MKKKKIGQTKFLWQAFKRAGQDAWLWFLDRTALIVGLLASFIITLMIAEIELERFLCKLKRFILNEKMRSCDREEEE